MVKFSWPFGDHIRRAPLHSKTFIYEEKYTQKKWASLLQTQKRSEKKNMKMNNIYSSHEEVPQQMSDSLGHFTVKLNVVNLLMMGILQCGCHVPTKINSLHSSMQLVTFISTDPTNLKSCCSFISFAFHFFLFIMKQNHCHFKEEDKNCPTFVTSSTDHKKG